MPIVVSTSQSHFIPVDIGALVAAHTCDSVVAHSSVCRLLAFVLVVLVSSESVTFIGAARK